MQDLFQIMTDLEVFDPVSDSIRFNWSKSTVALILGQHSQKKP